ncbi:unnamed protein product [Orchesella dallaii]|uniref:C2H2-type domain-containing protein n=1 Tax=Orchesella dallaii TaxID=48710 RepID=A0ABP1RNI5_9HEXA
MGKVSKRARSDKTKHPEDDGVSVGTSLELPDFKSKKRKPPVRSDYRKHQEDTVPSIGRAVWKIPKKRSQKKPPVRSDIPKRYPCIYTECTKDFSTNFGMCKHVERSHHFVRCGTCDKFMSELEFRSHSTSTKKCQNAGFTRWRKDPTQEWDWDLNWKEKVVEKPPVRSDNTPRILCIYYHKGCPSDFASRVGMHKHVRRCHHFLRCGTCDEFMSEFQFPSHRTSNEKCNNANFIRWNKKEGVEADWDLKWSDPVRSDKTKRISCIYAQSKGCQADFKKNRHMYKHVKRFHHYLECNICNEVMSEHDFSSHRTSNKKCKNATFTRLNEDLQQIGAWDLKWQRSWRKENPSVRSDTNVKIPCLNAGCISDFSEQRHMLDHVSKTHHTIICRSCTTVMSEFEFGVHRSKSLKCRHAILKRWNPLTQSEADWDLNWRRKLQKWRPPEVSTDNTDRYKCIYYDNGCTDNYSTKQSMCKHISKFHHVVKCNSCTALVSEFDFSSHQRKSPEKCKDASFTRWNLDLEQEGDWDLNWKDKIIFKDIYSKMRAQKAKKVRSDVMKTGLLQNPFRHRSKMMSLSCEVSECAFTTPYKTRLALHYKTEHNSRNWAVKFDSYNEVNVECTTNGCDFSTNSEVLMSTHTKGHKQSYPFLCELCSHLFKTKDLVRNHLMEIHKVHKHRSRLFRHLRFPTQGTEKSKSTCDICGKQVKHLKLHEHRSHPPELSESTCPFCTETIPDPEPLNDNPTMSCEEPSCEFQSCSRSAYRDHAFTHDTMKNAITGFRCSQTTTQAGTNDSVHNMPATVEIECWSCASREQSSQY